MIRLVPPQKAVPSDKTLFLFFLENTSFVVHYTDESTHINHDRLAHKPLDRKSLILINFSVLEKWLHLKFCLSVCPSVRPFTRFLETKLSFRLSYYPHSIVTEVSRSSFDLSRKVQILPTHFTLFSTGPHVTSGLGNRQAVENGGAKRRRQPAAQHM